MSRNYGSVDRDIFQHQVVGIAEEMSRALRRTAYSSIIWDSYDYACAACGYRFEVVHAGASGPSAWRASIPLAGAPTSLRRPSRPTRPQPRCSASLELSCRLPACEAHRAVRRGPARRAKPSGVNTLRQRRAQAPA